MKQAINSINNKEKSIENFSLGFVFFIAFFMRIFPLFQSGMIHDELSAVFRCKMPDLSYFLEVAIYPDTHPPLIQFFIYLWTKCFGIEDWVVKFPFFILGMLSLYYTFLLAKVFTQSHWIALFTVVILSCTQLHLTYSLVARMYISGLLFSMALVYHWWSWIKVDSSKKHYFYMLLFAFLSSYNHHLSMLLTLLVWFSGFFFINKKLVTKYILAILVFIILYIPCAYISYFQLTEIKGLNWLGTPDFSFFKIFFTYLASYNWIIIFTFWSGFILFFLPKNLYSTQKIILVGLLWFFSSLLITFCYSIFVSPIIQVHLFIFTVPFLILVIAIGIGRFVHKPSYWLAIFSVYFVLNLYVLVFQRKFYELFPKQPYKVLAENVKNHLESGKCMIITNLFTHYVSLYFNQKELNEITFITDSELGIYTMDSLLIQYPTILISNNEEAISSIFSPYYTAKQPTLRLQGSSHQILTRNGSNVKECLKKNEKDKFQIFDLQNFRKKQQNWEETKGTILRDTLSGIDQLINDKGVKWFSVFDIKQEMKHPFAMSIEFKADSIEKDALIIVSLNDEEKNVYYSARRFIDFIKINNNEWQKAYVGFPSSICFENQGKTLKLSLACLKSDAGTITSRNAKILSVESNPYLYSIVADIEE